MTRERAQELRDDARARQDEGELQAAGDLYTACAHEYAAITRRTFPAPGGLQFALGHLLDAATCYRIAGDAFRAANRCELGTVLAEDRFEYVRTVDVREQSFEDLRRGAWPEFIGDLRTIAQRDDAGEAYETAIDIYESAGEWEIVMAEKEHMRLAAFFSSVKRGAGHEIPRDAPERLPLDGPTFSEWVEYKRERLPGLLNELEEQGEWPTD